ncbi:hypothetical protein L208DRAFT_1325612 [Tricholoma matsutake]|nr:hypothetical protein L208DRAFT_1325612 [Tricholoma matsutake 945]
MVYVQLKHDDSIATVENPPNHEAFQGLSVSVHAKGSPLLECWLHDIKAVQNSAAASTMPVIHLHMPGGPDRDTPASTSSAPRLANAERLLSAGKMGIDLSIDDFCKLYDLSSNILAQLKENGYKKTKMLKYVTISQLHEMSFKHGEIASLHDPVDEWVNAL